MRRVLTKRLSILVLASLILCGFGVSAYAYDISGTVRNASGTPINGTADQIQVTAFQGDSCGWIQWKGSAPIDTNGGYTISGLLDGDYYLQTDNTNKSGGPAAVTRAAIIVTMRYQYQYLVRTSRERISGWILAAESQVM